MSDSGKNFWCIVDYFNGVVPMYYAGYYKTDSFSGKPIRPVITIDFNKALKLHSKEEATRILYGMNLNTWKVEEHGYF